MRSKIYSIPDDNNYFAIPDNCRVIWVGGCGGGGGGGGANSTSGACGGSSAPAFWRVPLSVKAGKVIGVRVAKGGLGGASGLPGQSANSGNYVMASSVCGSAIISPLVAASYLPFFSMGFGEPGAQSAGGGSGPPNIYSTTSSAIPNTRMINVNVDKFDWAYGAKVFPLFLMHPSSTGDVGRAGPLNPFGFGANDRNTFMGNGIGDEAVSDAVNGTGGSGGGSIFGKGGPGGIYSGAIGAGGAGAGYGAGGGGGSGGPGPFGAGGDGAPGLVIIEY